MRKFMRTRMGAGRQPGVAALGASQINTVVRRLGFVAQKAYETMVSNLIAADDAGLAEALGDAFKPVVDYMIHFDIDQEMQDATVSDETEV